MRIPRPEDLRDGIKEIEATVIDVVSAVIPWLAPLIPAYIAYQNMSSVLGFAPWLARIGALVVEALGLAAVHTAIQFWDFNRTRRQKDAAAPVKIAAAVGLFYLVLVLMVNIILDSAPVAEKVAKALLSLISVPAGVTLAIRAQHSNQILEIKIERERLREERKNNRSETLAAISAPQPAAQLAEPAAASGPYECVCGRVFEKPQSYSAHTRSCKVLRPSSNGLHKEKEIS